MTSFSGSIKKVKEIDSLADQFVTAFYEKQWDRECDSILRDLSIEDSYVVQEQVAKKRVERGEEIVGFKVGCTSAAIRAQFGLAEPINGKLFHPHVFDENAVLDWSDYFNCAIEPEMVFKIGKEITGKDLSDEELMDSIEYVSPAIEIHNFHFWHRPTLLQELICSGGIHAGLVMGKTKVCPRALNFRDEVFHVYKDNSLECSAPAMEIMGGPLHSLRWLVGFLAERQLPLKEGSLVIPGSPTELVTINEDVELKVNIEKLGDVVAFFKNQKAKQL